MAGAFYLLKSGSHVQGSGETAVFVRAGDPNNNVLWSEQDLARADPSRWERLDQAPQQAQSPAPWPVGPMAPLPGSPPATAGTPYDPSSFLPRPPSGPPFEPADFPASYQRPTLEEAREQYASQHHAAVENAKAEFNRVRETKLRLQQEAAQRQREIYQQQAAGQPAPPGGWRNPAGEELQRVSSSLPPLERPAGGPTFEQFAEAGEAPIMQAPPAQRGPRDQQPLTQRAQEQAQSGQFRQQQQQQSKQQQQQPQQEQQARQQEQQARQQQEQQQAQAAAARAQPGEVDDLEQQTVESLRDTARKEKVDLPPGQHRKDELVRAIRAKRTKG